MRVPPHLAAMLPALDERPRMWTVPQVDIDAWRSRHPSFFPRTGTTTRTTYAVACPGFVKVGLADHVLRRIAVLQVGNPCELELIGFRPGNVERRVHLALEAAGVARAMGEWFSDGAVLRAVLVEHELVAEVQ